MSNYTLTAEQMMDGFPLALQKDPKMVALAHSVANVLKMRLDEVTLGQIYTRIDELPEDLLDILAKDFAVDWYDSSYSLQAKRKTIKDCWYVHRHRGTKAAVETSISALYPHSSIEEWFNYNGTPYHFRVKISSDTIDMSKHERIRRKVVCYKNLRSYLDSITYELSPQIPPPVLASITPCSMHTSYTVRLQNASRKVGYPK